MSISRRQFLKTAASMLPIISNPLKAFSYQQVFDTIDYNGTTIIKNYEPFHLEILKKVLKQKNEISQQKLPDIIFQAIFEQDKNLCKIKQSSRGTGILLTKKGHVLTAYHVLEDYIRDHDKLDNIMLLFSPDASNTYQMQPLAFNRYQDILLGKVISDSDLNIPQSNIACSDNFDRFKFYQYNISDLGNHHLFYAIATQGSFQKKGFPNEELIYKSPDTMKGMDLRYLNLDTEICNLMDDSYKKQIKGAKDHEKILHIKAHLGNSGSCIYNEFGEISGLLQSIGTSQKSVLLNELSFFTPAKYIRKLITDYIGYNENHL